MPRLRDERVDWGGVLPRIESQEGRNNHPIGPGLGHERMGLNLVEEFLTLLADFPNLLRRGRFGQRSSRGVQLLMKLIHLRLERDQLLPGIFVFAQCGNGLDDFLTVDLRREIDPDHNRFAVEVRRDPLIEHQHDAGCIRADFILRDIKIAYDRHAFEIGRHLFERVALCGLRRELDRVLARVAIAHAVLTAGRHDADFSPGLIVGKEPWEEQDGCAQEREG